MDSRHDWHRVLICRPRCNEPSSIASTLQCAQPHVQLNSHTCHMHFDITKIHAHMSTILQHTYSPGILSGHFVNVYP